MSFLAVAGKKTTDVREFLREAADTGGVKYRPEKGKKHYIFIPFKEVSDLDKEGNAKMVREIVAISGGVHEWESMDGKYKTTICLKDVVRSNDAGEVLNDGSCPICDRISDSWDVYRYRHDNEEKNCGKDGEELEKHMEIMRRTFASERKARETRDYIYLLVVQYRTDANGAPKMDSEGLPEYDLKVMKMSATRVEKIQQQIENSGIELAGCELIFEYPNTDDARLVVSKSTTAPVFPESKFVRRFPGLIEKIQTDIDKFTWDGIEKSFQEWQGMTTAEAKSVVDALFEKWDDYKKQLAVNPAAKYMEYVGVQKTRAALPPLEPESSDTDVKMPGSIPDVNTVFGANKAPSINI